MISRVGVLSSFQSPSSRFSLRAAKSNRALCASQGLISWSNDIVGVAGAILSPILALLPFHRRSRLFPVTRDLHLDRCRLSPEALVWAQKIPAIAQSFVSLGLPHGVVKPRQTTLGTQVLPRNPTIPIRFASMRQSGRS